MSIDPDGITQKTVIGFEWEYRLNSRLTVSVLGNVPGGIAIVLTHEQGGSDPDVQEQITIPVQHYETLVSFLKTAWGKREEQEGRAKKFRQGI